MWISSVPWSGAVPCGVTTLYPRRARRAAAPDPRVGQTSRVTPVTSHPAFFLLYRPVKARDEFQEVLPNAGSPALAREGPEAAGAAAALPERGHGAAAGQADAAVPAQGAPGCSSIPVPGEHTVIIHAGLAAQAVRSRVLEGAALVEAVLAAQGHGAEPAAGAALAGEAGLGREEGSWGAAATARAGLCQLQRAQHSVVIHLPWKQEQRAALASAGQRRASPLALAAGSEVLPAP